MRRDSGRNGESDGIPCPAEPAWFQADSRIVIRWTHLSANHQCPQWLISINRTYSPAILLFLGVPVFLVLAHEFKGKGASETFLSTQKPWRNWVKTGVCGLTWMRYSTCWFDSVFIIFAISWIMTFSKRQEMCFSKAAIKDCFHLTNLAYCFVGRQHG